LFISQERYDEIKTKHGVPQKDDMLLTSVGTLGIPYIIMENEVFYFKDGNITWFYDFNGLDSRFLYYWFLSPIGRQMIDSKAIGSTQKALTIEMMSKFEITLPSLEEQKKIAGILGAIDDKIENNRRINENLEQQAQAFFKQWFVDFIPFKESKFVESELGLIPQGWKVVSLDDMTSKFGTGLNPRQNFKLGEGDNYYVTIKNMCDNRIYIDNKCDKITNEAIEKINKRSKLQKGDLLFSGIGTIGRVAMLTETPTNWNTSESVFNMHPKEGYSTEFLYVLLLSDAFQQYVKIHSQGGVQQGIRMVSLKQYQMAVPDYKTIKTFDDIVVPIISQIREKDKENDCLTTLRDTLLPKLINGEIKL
jgi:type I restriction enzyme S subunit